MRFSIIITTFGRKGKVERAILSCLKQKYDKKYEILVIDDNGRGSKDQIETEKIVSKYSDIKYIVQNKNEGANIARNRGIKEAKGEYILFLDDDDEFLENKLFELEKIIFLENADLIFSEVFYIEEKTQKVIKSKKNLVNILEVKKEILKENFIGSNSFVCLRRKKAIEVGLFNPKLKSCQDWDMWIRIVFNDGKISYCSKNLVNYYIDTLEGTRISNNYQKKLEGHLFIKNEIEKKYLKFFNKYDQKKIRKSQIKRIGDVYYTGENFFEYRRCLRRAYDIFEFNIKDYIKYICSYFNIKLNRFSIRSNRK